MQRTLRFHDAVIAAFVVRLVVVGVSSGSNDPFLWYGIAETVADHGLVDAYRLNEMLNHPPVPTLFMTVMRSISDLTALPYSWLVKIPALLSDVVAAWAIHRIVTDRAGRDAGRRACVVFLWSPVTIALSAYHGNTDSVYGVFLLLAAWAAVRRPFAAGGLLAAAVNVKLLPVLAGPALLLVQRTRATALRFVAGCALAIVPFVPLLLIDADAILDKVVGYTSAPQSWGPSQFLTLATGGWGDDPGTGPLASRYVDAGRYILAFAIVATAVLGRRRRADPIAMVVAGGTAYLLVTPGMGVQHLAMVAAAIHAADPRRARGFAVVGGIYVVTLYGGFLRAGFPLMSIFHNPAPYPAIVTGAVLWLWLGRLWWLAVSGRLSSSDPQGIDGDAHPALGSLHSSQGVGEHIGRGGSRQPAAVHRAAHLDAER